MKYTPEETKKYINEFLDINTRNQKKISITTDLDDKYKPIIKKLGLKTSMVALVHAQKKT